MSCSYRSQYSCTAALYHHGDKLKRSMPASPAAARAIGPTVQPADIPRPQSATEGPVARKLLLIAPIHGGMEG